MPIRRRWAIENHAAPAVRRGRHVEAALRAGLLGIRGRRGPVQLHASALIAGVHGLQIDTCSGTGPTRYRRGQSASDGNLHRAQQQSTS